MQRSVGLTISVESTYPSMLLLLSSFHIFDELKYFEKSFNNNQHVFTGLPPDNLTTTMTPESIPTNPKEKRGKKNQSHLHSDDNASPRKSKRAVAIAGAVFKEEFLSEYDM